MPDTDCQNLEAASANLADAIRFTEIPHSTRLFTDFLYDYSKVARFYPDCGRAVSPIAEHARYIGAQQFDRQRVPDALERINRRLGSSELTFKHIETLRRPGSVAIVTGQQAGLFGGPLYTIHKALTVVKLSQCLTDAGINAVPVFWIASEDHDYDEVNHLKVIGVDGQIKEIRYEGRHHKPETPVGQIRLCEGISQSIDQLLAALPPSEFIPEIEQALRDSYQDGRGFAEAFGRLMAWLFKDYGVVLLDPLDEQLKRVAGPIYVRALEKSGEIASALVQRSSDLEQSGYHAQIHVSQDMVPLFIMDDGRRVAMHESDGRFYVKGSDRSYGNQELAELASRCSTCFSPNVTLRPVVQDYLLPTAAYIGGPAEVAYFAQIGAVYKTLDRPEPCILPRGSFTIVEGRHQKTMKKYSLGLRDFFEGLHPAMAKVVEQSLDRETANAFTATEQIFTAQLDKLESALLRTDATLAASLKHAREKVLYQIEHLRTRFVHSGAKRDENASRQVERAYTALYPEKTLQERVVNVFYFLARYGPSLLNDLYQAVDVGYSNHKMVYIGGAASQVVNAAD